MNELLQKVNSIQSREDFIEFVQILHKESVACPQKWENNTLPRYLNAIASFVEDLDGYYLNNGETMPDAINWKVIGDILMAASMYE